MRYWWANQKQTYDIEVAGGFLWSRQRRIDGSRNPFYENLRLTQTGDLVFAYTRAAIRAVGVVLRPANAAPSPTPPNCHEPQTDVASDGWLVDMAWLELQRPLKPSAYMSILAPLLPNVHAPLTADGRGIQGGRLLELPERLALALLQLAGGRDPAHILNPAWSPQQLCFAFAESGGRSATPQKEKS